MKLISPAKINLRLKCVGRYSDGYHELEMINMRFPLNDYIYIKEAKENKLNFLNSTLDPTKDDLVLKVLEELQEKYRIINKYDIVIEKNIPIGAGLGGGSSNAATIINYINETHQLGLSLEERIKLGKKYGADIPYCLFSTPCIVRGVGEDIKEINLNIEEEILIVNPNIYISTIEVFKNNKKFSNKVDLNVKNYLDLLENDLEESAFSIDNRLKKVKEYLESLNVKKVVMSGSGSSFIVLVDKNKKEYIYNKIKEEKEYLVFK